jgi:hypothetical protein
MVQRDEQEMDECQHRQNRFAIKEARMRGLIGFLGPLGEGTKPHIKMECEAGGLGAWFSPDGRQSRPK